jgi:hypothetical protein
VPTPVIFSVLPLTVAGPLATLKFASSPEVESADRVRVIGVPEYVTGLVGWVKAMVCAALFTVNCTVFAAVE